MTAKLTLSIDEEKIKKIKAYSKENGISVSKFVEAQIEAITSAKPKKKLDISILKGAFGKELKGFDRKKIKTEHLIRKYGL